MFGMAGRRGGTPAPPEDFEENIVDIDVGEEMRGSYLEYAYSVIYSRALPDARDGLKPVRSEERRVGKECRSGGEEYRVNEKAVGGGRVVLATRTARRSTLGRDFFFFFKQKTAYEIHR